MQVSLEGYGVDAETGAPTAVVMYRLLCALKKKIDDTKASRLLMWKPAAGSARGLCCVAHCRQCCVHSWVKLVLRGLTLLGLVACAGGAGGAQELHD